MSESDERAPQAEPQANLPATRRGPSPPTMRAGGEVASIIPQSLEEAFRLATAMASSGLMPRGMDTQPKVLVAILAGAELGLPPFQATQSFAVINGRPSLWGDAIPALLWSRGFKLKEWFENSSPDYPDNMVAKCVVTRPDGEEINGEFSVADAKEAELFDMKAGPWKTSKKRMLKMRARAFTARDGAADVLRGMQIREEVEDYGDAMVVRDNAAPSDLRARLTRDQGDEGFTRSHAEIDPVDFASRSQEGAKVAEEMLPAEPEHIDAEVEDGAPAEEGPRDDSKPAGQQTPCKVCGAPIGQECAVECTSWDDLDPSGWPDHVREARGDNPQPEGSTATGSSESTAEPKPKPTTSASTDISSTEPGSSESKTRKAKGAPPADLFAEAKPTVSSPGFDVRAWADEIERNLPHYAGNGSILAGDFADHAADLERADRDRFNILKIKVAKRVNDLAKGGK